MKCPQCGNQNDPGAAFCDNCGHGLAGAASAASQVAPTAYAGSATCPACQASVIPGEAFCGNCGNLLAAVQPSVAPAPPQQPLSPPYQPPQQQAYQPPYAPPAPQQGGGVTCTVCGTTNPPGTMFCDSCGASLPGQQAAAQPHQAASPPHAAAYPPASYPPGGQSAYGGTPVGSGYGAPAKLVVASSGHTFDLSGKQEALIGREDPVSNVFPEVDLTNHGGLESGVGRTHAKLLNRGGQWLIEDLNSTNGTWVNKNKVNAGTPHPLNPGDEVRLGRVILNFRTS